MSLQDLGLTFQLTFDYFGDTRAHNLLPDGGENLFKLYFDFTISNLFIPFHR